MDIGNVVLKYFNNSPLSFIKTIAISDIIFDDRAVYMCKYGCKNYNRKYSCPPFSLALKKQIQAGKYKYATIFATTSKTNKDISRWRLRSLNHQKESEIQRISMYFHNMFSHRGVNHIILSGGACKRCRPCYASIDEPCGKPDKKQTSMEAVGIDCQRTLHKTGFDFEMPNIGSINRCGCILSNEETLKKVFKQKRKSYQLYKKPLKKDAIEIIEFLKKDYSDFFSEIRILPVKQLKRGETLCDNNCTITKKGFSCPPYSIPFDLNLWKYAIVWKWRGFNYKKKSYNQALKIIHKAIFSSGFYFALSFRNCYCCECKECNNMFNNEHSECKYKSILSPSMQSQGIDPIQFGNGKYGIEII